MVDLLPGGFELQNAVDHDGMFFMLIVEKIEL